MSAIIPPNLFRIGASFAGVQSGGAGSTTFLAAASNVNGAILRYFWITSAAGIASAIFADTAAASAAADFTKRNLGFCPGGVTIGPVFPNQLIPAGRGIFFYANGAGCAACAGWDLL